MSERQPYESLPKVEVRASDEGEWEVAYHIRTIELASFPYLAITKDNCSNTWKQMRPHQEPTKRPMTHKEVFKAIHEGAIVTNNCGTISNNWSTNRDIKLHEISYDWGDTWQECEVEE